jgi:hypothetical protein
VPAELLADLPAHSFVFVDSSILTSGLSGASRQCRSRASQEPLAFADSGRYWHCLLVNGCGLREVGVQAVFQVAIVVMLKLFQVLFDKVEAHNTKLELLRKPAKQWSFIPVFELVK